MKLTEWIKSNAMSNNNSCNILYYKILLVLEQNRLVLDQIIIIIILVLNITHVCSNAVSNTMLKRVMCNERGSGKDRENIDI